MNAPSPKCCSQADGIAVSAHTLSTALYEVTAPKHAPQLMQLLVSALHARRGPLTITEQCSRCLKLRQFNCLPFRETCYVRHRHRRRRRRPRKSPRTDAMNNGATDSRRSSQQRSQSNFVKTLAKWHINRKAIGQERLNRPDSTFFFLHLFSSFFLIIFFFFFNCSRTVDSFTVLDSLLKV